MAPENLPPVAGPGALPTAQIRKGDTGTERHVPWVASEHRAGFRIDLRHNRERGCCARRAEHPLDIGGDRKPPGSLRRVADRQPPDLDRIIERHVLEKIERDTLCGLLLPAVCLALPREL